MIRLVMSGEELSGLPEKGVEAQKIRALWLCYGSKYEFCRFYSADYAVICELNGSFVVCELRKLYSVEFDELNSFFLFHGYSEIFCSEYIGKELSEAISCSAKRVELMRFCGKAESCILEENPPLEEVFKILKTGFSIEFEPWYLDMSHRIRHGVTRFFRLGDSVAAVQHELCGEALLSQIATLPKSRNKGNASRLISAMCAKLDGSDIFIICEDSLEKFYEKNGFIYEKTCFVLVPRKNPLINID